MVHVALPAIYFQVNIKKLRPCPVHTYLFYINFVILPHMKKPSIHLIAFFQAMGVTAYVALIITILNQLTMIFASIGERIPFLGPLIILLLFVLSAAITGSIVLGYPLMLFLEKRKNDALILFCETIGFLIGITFLVITGIVLSSLA